MALFDLENAVQQGLNVNTTTNDKQIEAQNLGVKLDSAGTFQVQDSNENAVFEVRDDGYASVLGNLEVHGGNVLIQGTTNTDFITLKDAGQETSVLPLNADPNGAVTATKGSLGLDYTDGYVFVNQDGSTGWERLAGVSELSGSVTLQQAYKNDVDGGDATITTDSIDGSVVIAGTESLKVTATGGIVATKISATGVDLNISTITDGQLKLTGAHGIVVNGDGYGIVPAATNTDALGSANKVFSDVYIENVANTAGVSLKAAGGSSAPNTTSGASAVGTNSANFDTFGPSMTSNTVQAALEAIDGYVANIQTSAASTYTKKVGLDINGAVLNGVIKVNTDSGTPALDFTNKKLGRASWSIPVPSDWNGSSNIDVNVIWSPETTNDGYVVWNLEYKSLGLTELVSTAATVVSYVQTACGTLNAIQTTNSHLSIPAAAINTADEVIVINVVRLGGDAGDTFTDSAQVCLVKYSYTAKNTI